MNWFEKWMERRRIKALKQKLARMKREAEVAEVELAMPALETVSRKIRLERITVLEKAVQGIESKSGAAESPDSERVAA
jgi:hypothetical protein